MPTTRLTVGHQQGQYLAFACFVYFEMVVQGPHSVHASALKEGQVSGQLGDDSAVDTFKISGLA